MEGEGSGRAAGREAGGGMRLRCVRQVLGGAAWPRVGCLFPLFTVLGQCVYEWGPWVVVVS